MAILGRCQKGEWHLIGSEALDLEIFRIPDGDRRQRVLVLAGLVRRRVPLDAVVVKRAYELQEAGFKAIDALHLAAAEKGKADVFLTTDDGLLRRAAREKGLVKIRVENPVNWLMEVIQHAEPEHDS
ncbi:MAG: PIN domain-containing protein [Clostridia bacterium]|nr:MAG: PIN domain-containing protein [Clostridia bacterium]